jgi:DNA-binding LacI/PurR family transcriptional regulator
MSERAATIMDVAKLAGVSKTTASDALAGAGRVSEATKERITAAANDLGYAPNRAAQHLRRSSVGAVGLYIPPRVMSMSFYMEFAFGAADEAQAFDLDLTLLAAPSRSHRLRRPRVDGLMVVDPLPEDPVVAGLFGSGLPTVAVGRYEGTGAKASATLEVDHFAMILQLLDHVASADSRRPGLIAPDTDFDSSWARQVKSAYRNWCSARRIEPQVREVAVDIDPTQIDDAVTSLVQDAGVDGLVCAPDGSAVRALTTLRALGVAVGADFPLASCAGGRGTELSVPSITAIDLRPHDYGMAATRLLTDILAGEITPPAHRTHRAVLTPRASTAGPGVASVMHQ